MLLNWKIIKTKSGNISFALCSGDKLIREYSGLDLGLATHREKDSDDEFENSIDDYLDDKNAEREARERGEYYKNKVETVDSTAFRALQRKIQKKEEEKKK